MNTIDTLKMALEALEYWDVHGKLHQPTEEAITAIKQALNTATPLNDASHLVAPVQEPVAWMYQCTADNSGPVLLRHRTDWAESGTGLWIETPLYTTPPNVAAPLAAQPAPTSGAAKMPCGAVVSNVYDAYEAGKKAAQRQWVHATPWRGLTDDEIEDCYTDQIFLFAKKLEAKLKEKNSD